MTKQEIPKTGDASKENPFVNKEGKLDTELIAKFQEALKTDAAKDYDFNKEFNVTAVPKTDQLPKPDTTTPAPEVPKTSDEDVKDSGYKFEDAPQTSKMSEAEAAVKERLDKIAEIKYTETKNSVLETDKDFPVTIVDKLTGLAPEDKALVMAAFKEVAVRGTDATKKLQDELTAANDKLEDPKFSEFIDESAPKTGKEKVEAMRAHFGIKTEDKKD